MKFFLTLLLTLSVVSFSSGSLEVNAFEASKTMYKNASTSLTIGYKKPPTLTFKSPVPKAPVNQIVPLALPNLRVSVANDTPAESVLLSDTDAQPVSKYVFAAFVEDHEIHSLDLLVGSRESAMRLVDPNAEINSVDVVTASFRSHDGEVFNYRQMPIDGVVSFPNLRVPVSVDGPTELLITVDTLSRPFGAVSGEDVRIGIANQNFSAVGVESGRELVGLHFTNARTLINTHELRHTTLLLTNNAEDIVDEDGLLRANLRPLLNGEIHIFELVAMAGEEGDVKLGYFEFDLLFDQTTYEAGRDNPTMSHFRVVKDGHDITDDVFITDLNTGVDLRAGAINDIQANSPLYRTRIRVTFTEDESTLPRGRQATFDIRASFNGLTIGDLLVADMIMDDERLENIDPQNPPARQEILWGYDRPEEPWFNGYLVESSLDEYVRLFF